MTQVLFLAPENRMLAFSWVILHLSYRRLIVGINKSSRETRVGSSPTPLRMMPGDLQRSLGTFLHSFWPIPKIRYFEVC